MGWRVTGSNRYFYRSVRTNGRVRSIYLGKGAAADLAALQLRRRQEAREEARHAHQQALAEAASERATAQQIHAQIELALAAGLVDAGCYLHCRGGSWRVRKQVARTAVPKHQLPCSPTLPELVREANRRNEAALAELRSYLQLHPEIYESAADLVKQSLEACITRMGKGDLDLAESMRLHASAIRKGLEMPNPTALESLIIDNAVWCHTELASFYAGKGTKPHWQRDSAPNPLCRIASQRLRVATGKYMALKARRAWLGRAELLGEGLVAKSRSQAEPIHPPSPVDATPHSVGLSGAAP